MKKKSYVKEWMILRGFNIHALGKKAGVSRSTIYRLIDKVDGGRYKPRKKIAAALGVSIEQLRKRPSSTDNSEYVKIPYIGDHPELYEGEIIYLPHFKVKVSAGGEITISEPIIDKEVAFKSVWIHKKLDTDPKNLFLVDVSGDSMEPTFHDGDILLVDRSKNNLQTDGIYVFRDEKDMYVKRVERQLGGRILLKSDNSRYESYYFDPDHYGNKVFGRVVWYASTMV